MSMNFQRKLPLPKEVKQDYPLTENMIKIKTERDEKIKSVLMVILINFY